MGCGYTVKDKNGKCRPTADFLPWTLPRDFRQISINPKTQHNVMCTLIKNKKTGKTPKSITTVVYTTYVLYFK